MHDVPKRPPAWTTHCPNCGRPMALIKTVPASGALSELRIYECKSCGVTYTEAAEASAPFRFR